MYMIARQHTQSKLYGTGREAFIAFVKENNFKLAKSLNERSGDAGIGSVLDKAVKTILTAFYDVDHFELAYIGEMLGIINDLDQSREEEKMALETAQSSKLELKKEVSRKRQDNILQKFQTQRQSYMKSKSLTQQSETPRSSFRTDTLGDDESEDDIECSLCKESLTTDQFYKHPFGQFAYVSSTKLLFHAYRQALKVEPTNEDEEEKKGEEIIEEDNIVDPLQELEINCLHKTTGTGGTLIKCSHYAHYKCLMSYLVANEQDQRKREVRKMIGIDF